MAGFIALALAFYVPVQPQLHNRRASTTPVCIDPGAAIGDFFSGVAGDAAVQLRLGADEFVKALPEIERAARPVIDQASEEVKVQGLGFAAKVASGVGAGLEAVAPVMRSGLEETGGFMGKVLTGQLTPDQQAALERTGAVASQAGEMAGGVARGAVTLGSKAVSSAAPVVGRLASDGLTAGRQAYETVSPAVLRSARSLVESGQLPADTVEELGRAAEQGSRSLVKGAAAVFRSAASIMDDSPPSLPAGGGAMRSSPFAIPSLRETTDSVASSLVRASAPYVRISVLSFTTNYYRSQLAASSSLSLNIATDRTSDTTDSPSRSRSLHRRTHTQ